MGCMTARGDGERGQHDRQEALEREELGRRALARSFARCGILAASVETLAGRTSSSLAGDRSATPYSSVPDQVRANLGVALDHLHAFKIIVADGGTVLPFTMFTLVRSAYEAAATALWLLHPTSRDERVLRPLKLARDNRLQVHNVMEKSGREDPGWDRAITALERDRDGRKALVGVKLTSVVSVTDRLVEIAVLFPDLFLAPLALWQTSSGMAQGNSAMMLLLLDREQVCQAQHGGADYSVTTSLIVVANYFDAAPDLWDSRNRPSELH